MTHSIHLELSRAEGVLVRVLGLTERRGWTPLTVSAEPAGADRVWLRMTVLGDRPVEHLVRQLAKLVDVREILTLGEAMALEVAR